MGPEGHQPEGHQPKTHQIGRPRRSAVGYLPTPEALELARLKGESDGRLLARIEERRLIVDWLKFQTGTPRDLAHRIACGEHTRS